MNRDPFDIDDIFREIERMLDDLPKHYGGHLRGISDDRDIMEDDKNIYLTYDVHPYDPETVKAEVSGDYLKINIDGEVSNVKIPRYADRVKDFTINNCILDITISKEEYISEE